MFFCFVAVLLFSTVLPVSLGQDGLFPVQRRICDGALTYLTKTHEGREFVPYVRLSGHSEEDCARKCWERTQFCTSIKYLRGERLCEFSVRYISCQKEESPFTTSRFQVDRIAYCIQCNGDIRLTKLDPEFKVSDGVKVDVVSGKDQLTEIPDTAPDYPEEASYDYSRAPKFSDDFDKSDYIYSNPNLNADYYDQPTFSPWNNLHPSQTESPKADLYPDYDGELIFTPWNSLPPPTQPAKPKVQIPANGDYKEPIFSPWSSPPSQTEPSAIISPVTTPKLSNPAEIAPSIFELPVEGIPDELIDSVALGLESTISEYDTSLTAETTTWSPTTAASSAETDFSESTTWKVTETPVADKKISEEFRFEKLFIDNSPRYTNYNSSCSLGRLRPCVFGFGNGCQVEQDLQNPTCYVCTCPYSMPMLFV